MFDINNIAEMNIAVKVNRNQFDVIIPLLFVLGYTWVDKSKDARYPSAEDQIYLFIRSNGKISYQAEEREALYIMHELDMSIEPSKYIEFLKLQVNQYLADVEYTIKS